MIRETYRSLLNSGRTYASFRDDDYETVKDRLTGRGPILDPTSGYGRLASFCSELGISTVNVEMNPPQYFWQLLVHPAHVQLTEQAATAILAKRRNWPRPRQRAVVSDEFFPQQSMAVLFPLFDLISNVYKEFETPHDALWMATAFILPFVGRMSCTSPGNLSTHTKEGGTCVLTGWQDDFHSYLSALARRLTVVSANARSMDHKLILGDARSVDLGGRSFAAMYTSPPYPNHRDFSSILLPENTFLQHLTAARSVPISFIREQIIGSNFVTGEVIPAPQSAVVTKFITEVSSLRRTKRAVYDDNVYYIPYLRKYFKALEDAYRHISQFLESPFEGYAVVVNNTHRGIVIPVASTLIDIWTSLGFHAEEFSAKETFHIGTKNPRAKGIRARHTECVVRIWR
jgi:hypothetical protein